MPFIAILIDLLTLSAYFTQTNPANTHLRPFGLIFQIVMTFLLFLLMLCYNGKKYSAYKPKGYRYLTIRYGLIVLSVIVNGIVLFLYVLYALEINPLIFSG